MILKWINVVTVNRLAFALEISERSDYDLWMAASFRWIHRSDSFSREKRIVRFNNHCARVDERIIDLEEFPDGKNAWFRLSKDFGTTNSSIRLCRVSINIKSRELANFFFSTVDKTCVHIMRECSTWGQDKSHGWNFSLSSLESRQFEDGGDKCSQYRRETCVYIRLHIISRISARLNLFHLEPFFHPSPPSSLDFRRLVLRYLCAPVIHHPPYLR